MSGCYLRTYCYLRGHTQSLGSRHIYEILRRKKTLSKLPNKNRIYIHFDSLDAKGS